MNNTDTILLIFIGCALFIGVLPLICLVIQASKKLKESQKRVKQIRKEIEELIDKM